MDYAEQQKRAMTEAGLNLIAQALSIYDKDLRLAVCNRRFKEMFDLPDRLVQPGARFEDTIRHLLETGEYGEVTDPEAFIRARVDQALAFEPHYLERTRANGQVISIEGAPLPQGGWVAVYTDITRTKRVERLLRARSEELSDQLLAHAEELSATNRKLAATITALEEAKRQLTEIEARTRLTTEMMPAHIAHVDANGHYTYSNRRLSAVLPGRPSDILGMHIRDALGTFAHERIEPHLQAAYGGQSSVFEFTENHDSRRIRLLTIITGMQNKLEKMGLPEPAAELVAGTQAAVRRGARLLNRIADITGRRTLRPRATDLHMLLQDLKLIATPSLPQGVGLSVLDHTPDATLLLDAGMLQDALLNLILNARDACGSAGLITVSAHCVGRTWIEISVTDTGPGFSPEALKSALDPFFTTKGGEGSGLGLPMVYDMVKLAGGDLQIGNTPTGAQVTLRLPYREAPVADGGIALLVEDSPELREGFRDMLMELGYSVIEAETVDEAVALAADLDDIRLVLSDIRLRGDGTGIDLKRRIEAPDRPCILMTSLPQDDPLFISAQATGAVLRKPFTTADLSSLIRPEATA